MSEDNKIAIIPKGTKVQIMGCSYTILEDTKVDGTQIYLDAVLKAQIDYENQFDVIGHSKATSCPESI